MKPTLYTLFAAAAACGLASAAETSYSTPVGFTTQTLAANAFNLVGFNVQTPTLAAGDITGVAGAVVSDADIDFTTLPLPAGKTCVFEVTSDVGGGSGDAAGTVQDFVTWSGNDITLPSAVSGLDVGDTYAVRVVPTLQELFPAGLLTGSITAGNADKVWVPDGLGGYTKYWYKITVPPVGWHTTTTGSNDTGVVSADVPLLYIDGILVEKKGASADFELTGEVKTTGSNFMVNTGFNLVSVVPPTGLTLFTSGLDNDVTGSITAGNADKIWVPDGLGGYTKYWYKITVPPVGWHTTTTGSNDTGLAVDTDLPASILIERKGGTAVFSMDVPAEYDDL